MDPMTLLMVLALVVGFVAVWMVDSTYRNKLIKAQAARAEAEQARDKAQGQLDEARTARNHAKEALAKAKATTDRQAKELQKVKRKSKKKGAAHDDDVRAASDAARHRAERDLVLLRAEVERQAEKAEQVDTVQAELTALQLAHDELKARRPARTERPLRPIEVPEEAKEDLGMFLAKVKSDIVSTRRRAERNHEAYLAAALESDTYKDRLNDMRGRYRGVCRELAIAMGASAEVDDQEAAALAARAVEVADDAAQWQAGSVDADAEVAPEAADAEAAPEAADVEAAPEAADAEAAPEAADAEAAPEAADAEAAPEAADAEAAPEAADAEAAPEAADAEAASEAAEVEAAPEAADAEAAPEAAEVEAAPEAADAEAAPEAADAEAASEAAEATA